MRITEENEEKTISITDDDNLLIKGNNLLALATLNERYAGKIRMAYWDVPYNTGSDSFGYNDKFNRSSWLVFIKNRVEKLIPLLDNRSGVLLIQCSFYQYAYLKVLLDEIMGNHVMTFNVLVRHPDRTLTADKDFNDVVEYILVYSKSPSFKMPKMEEDKTVDDYTWRIEELTEGTKTTLGGKEVRIFNPDEYILKRVAPAKENYKIITVRGSIKEKNSSGRFYVKNLQPLEEQYSNKTLFKVEGIGDDMYSYRYFYLPPKGNKNGAYLQGMPTSSAKTYKPYPNFLDFVQSYNTVNDEGVVEFRNGKKPEDLIAFMMNVFTSEKDIVLDAFAGSGTTAAVAIKLNRQFIMIEQMDYAKTLTAERLIGVIQGKENDVLPESGYIDGGSFVYCELTKLNQLFIEKIQDAKTDAELVTIFLDLVKTGFISHKVYPNEIDVNASDFNSLSVDEKKRLLLELVDKNQLYVNRCDMDDESFHISEDDKAFTKNFYKER